MVVIGGSIALAILVYVAGRAKAGPGATAPMSFYGQLNDNGQPAAGTHQIGFDLWSDLNSTDASDHLSTMPVSAVSVAPDGSFQLPLSCACVAVFPLQTLIWYQFTVDGTAFPRAPVGAVPFAR